MMIVPSRGLLKTCCFTTGGNGILRDFANDNVHPGASGSGTSVPLMRDTQFNMQT